ncbi:MAG: hypothetical protein ABI145_17415 [Steroidobacteraceae bacterium]
MIIGRKIRARSQRTCHRGLVTQIVIGRQKHDNRIRCAPFDLQKRQQYAVWRAAILRLHEGIVVWQAFERAAPPTTVLLGHDATDVLRTRHRLNTSNSNFEQAGLSQQRAKLFRNHSPSAVVVISRSLLPSPPARTIAHVLETLRILTSPLFGNASSSKRCAVCGCMCGCVNPKVRHKL